MSNLAFNYMQTTSALGTFQVDSVGWIVGVFADDPATRNELSTGVLSTSEVLPMWGGVAISEAIPGLAGQPNEVLGGIISRATSLTAGIAGALTGFSVFNQAHAMATTPQSPVPLAASGMTVSFFRLGSQVRITVQIDPTLAAAIENGVITQPVSWDFVNSQIIAFQAAYAANVITASSWASTGGGQATFTTTTAHGVAVGQYVQISGETPPGYNGTWLTLAGTTGSTIVVSMPINPGASTVQGTLVAGGGALPAKILSVNIGGSMVVVFNSTTGFATWNRSGTTALILI